MSKTTTTKKAPRKSASAARAEGAAKTKRALAEAAAATEANIKAIDAAEQKTTVKRRKPAASAKATRTGTLEAFTMTRRKPAKAADQQAEPKVTTSRKKKTDVPTEKPKREPKAKRVSGLDLAAKVLASAKEPLNAKTIAERAIAAGWQTSGATPHATLYAAMIREITAKGTDARFRKTDRGMFTAAEKGA